MNDFFPPSKPNPLAITQQTNSPSLFKCTQPLYIQPVGNQTYKDCLRLQDSLDLEANAPSKQTLEKIIQGGQLSNNIFSNGPISYYINDHQWWQQEFTTYPDGRYAGVQNRSYINKAGTWSNNCTGNYGYKIFSLMQEMLGCNISWAYKKLGEYIGLSTTNSEIPQIAISKNEHFITCPASYNILPIPNHPVLGIPEKEYWITNEFGQPTLAYCQWTVGSQSVGLYYSLVFNSQFQMPVWKFVRPPAEAMLYNKHRIIHEPTLPIFICEDIGIADSLKNESLYVTTWANELEHIQETDWRIFAGRNVTYVMNNQNRDAYKIGNLLKEILSQLHTDLKIERFHA